MIGKLTAASSSDERKPIVRQSGCIGVYSFWKLPYHDCYLNTPVEPMHVIKNIAERIVKYLSGQTDTVKEWKKNNLKDLGIHGPNWSWKMVKVCIPPAPFSLQKNEIDIANVRAMNIRAPSGVDWRACYLFGKRSL